MYNPAINCYLCGSDNYEVIHKGVRGAEDVNVLKCKQCGLVRLDKFITDDNEKFYEESGMWKSNNMASNVEQARIDAEEDDERTAIFVKNYVTNKKVLDFGCGSGGFINKVKKVVRYISGVELEKDKRDYLVNEGTTCYENIDTIPSEEKYDIITMFHVLEHLPDPIEILNKLKNHLEKDGKIIIEVPNADDALLSLYKSKEFSDFTYWVCHLYLYSNKTILDLFEKCNLTVSFMQQIQRYPLSNHLYWLTSKGPGGHKKWAALNDEQLDDLYGRKLASLGIADTIIAVVEMK